MVSASELPQGVRVKIPKVSSGIYFLILEEEVVYVGQSKFNVFSRVGIHTRDKKFDEFHYLEINNDEDDDFMNLLEARFILEYLPIYNQTIPTNSRYFIESRIRKDYKCNAYVLKRFIRDKHIVLIVRYFSQLFSLFSLFFYPP